MPKSNPTTPQEKGERDIAAQIKDLTPSDRQALRAAIQIGPRPGVACSHFRWFRLAYCGLVLNMPPRLAPGVADEFQKLYGASHES